VIVNEERIACPIKLHSLSILGMDDLRMAKRLGRVAANSIDTVKSPHFSLFVAGIPGRTTHHCD
jgi:hypothetical protein